MCDDSLNNESNGILFCTGFFCFLLCTKNISIVQVLRLRLKLYATVSFIALAKYNNVSCFVYLLRSDTCWPGY